MAIFIDAVAIDCQDPARLAAWWAEALGWPPGTPDEDGDVFIEVPAGSGGNLVANLVFLKDPGTKQGKNRLHLDLRPDDRDAEVARFEALGATRVDIGQTGDESWVVMADPEGNEFCILASG